MTGRSRYAPDFRALSPVNRLTPLPSQQRNSHFSCLPSPALYSLPGSPGLPAASLEADRELARAAEEKAAEEALNEYMSRASLSARKASLPTSSLMSPADVEHRFVRSHARSASTSTISTRSSLASRPLTSDSMSSCQSSQQPGSPTASLSNCASPTIKRPTFKDATPAPLSPQAATSPRAYAFI